jgi:hypothetical protein
VELNQEQLGSAQANEEPFSNMPSSGESIHQIRARTIRNQHPGMSEEEAAQRSRQVEEKQYHAGSDPHSGEAAGKGASEAYAKRRSAAEGSVASAAQEDLMDQLRKQGRLREPAGGPSGAPGSPGAPGTGSEGPQRKRGFFEPSPKEQAGLGQTSKHQQMPARFLNNYLLMNQLMSRGGWQQAIRHAYGQPVSMESVFMQQAAGGHMGFGGGDQMRQDAMHPHHLNDEQFEGTAD